MDIYLSELSINMNSSFEYYMGMADAFKMIAIRNKEPMVIYIEKKSLNNNIDNESPFIFNADKVIGDNGKTLKG